MIKDKGFIEVNIKYQGFMEVKIKDPGSRIHGGQGDVNLQSIKKAFCPPDLLGEEDSWTS